MAQTAAQKNTNIDDQQELASFRPGDLAVYPSHGIGRIESIESQVIGGQKQDFYFMNIFQNNMVIMIPTKNVKSVGLRGVIRKEEVENIYKIIGEKSKLSQGNQSWNIRQKAYMEMIKSGSLYEVAKVFRDLYRLKLSKKLSFGERRILEMASTLLLKEISATKNQDEKSTLAELEGLF